MSQYRVAIVDDERLSRRCVRRFLAGEPDCELVAECGSGAEAMEALERNRADILFLDVQMPGMDGFEVVRALGEKSPLVIFTSAWDEYALRAFEVQAFDYLLKPFERRRFRDSLQRARTRLGQERTAIAPLDPTPKAPNRLAVRNNGRILFLKVAEIDWIEASDNYVCLHSGRETYCVRETMSELERRLDPALFLRVHRSAIVNIDRIRELQPWFRGEYRVVLHNGTELTLTRTHRDKLESRLLLS